MNCSRSTAYSDGRFDRVDSLASEVLSTELLAMYETYRNALMAHNVDAALIDSILSLFLWETCALSGDRVVH
jgi:hypothetical protein